MSKQNVTRQVSIYINDKEVKNSFTGISKEIAKTTNQLKNLDKSSKTYEEDLVALKSKLSGLKGTQEEFKKEIFDTNTEIKNSSKTAGDAREKLSQIFTGITTGNFSLVKEGFNGIAGSIKATAKAGLAFIATPIGATIALLVGAFAGAKAIFDFNNALTATNTKLKALGVESENLSKVRSEIEATASTFDKDIDTIIDKANSLAKTYGISIAEANQIIARGLADGNGDELLESLGEYDEFFAKAGFSAQGFVDIINTGIDVGIYADKLPDALKEADLALKEQTQSTKDALVNAFGASFTDSILKRVSSGAITTKQALEEIAAESEKAQLSQQQQAQLTADVFKGAGEDAGGALKILETITKSTQRELSETSKAQLKLQESTAKLNEAQARLFEIEGFGDTWKVIQAAAAEALASVLDYIADVKDDIQPLIDIVAHILGGAFVQLKLIVVSAFDVISGTLRAVFSFISGIIGGIANLLKGEGQAAIDSFAGAFEKAGKYIANIFIGIYNNLLDFAKGALDYFGPILTALGVDVDKLQAKLESFKGAEFEIKKKETTETSTTSGKPEDPTGTGKKDKPTDEEIAAAKKLADEKRKIKEQEEKEEKDRINAYLKAKADQAAAELSLFIANNQSKIEKNQQLSQELLDQETERLKAIKDKQLAFNEQEKERKIKEAEEKALSQREFDALREAIEIEYQLKKQAQELEFVKSTDALKEEYELEKAELLAQEEALKEEQKLLDEELAIEEAQTKDEAERLRNEQSYNTELAGYQKLLEDKKITQEKFDRFVEVAEKKKADFERQQDLANVNQKLQGMSTIANGLGEVFGQSKELASAQALINGGLAVTSILSAPPSGPEPLNSIVKGVSIAAALATTNKNIQKINSAKPPKAPKFFYGGHTGTNAALGRDEYGPITGYVHQKEYVIPEIMTQDPVYADTISWLENNRKAKLNGFVDGGAASQDLQASIGESPISNNTNLLVNAINTLNNLLGRGINAKLVIGYEEAQKIQDLNSEITQSTSNGTLSE